MSEKSIGHRMRSMEVRRVAAIGSSSTERTWRCWKRNAITGPTRAMAGGRLSAANLWPRLSAREHRLETWDLFVHCSKFRRPPRHGTGLRTGNEFQSLAFAHLQMVRSLLSTLRGRNTPSPRRKGASQRTRRLRANRISVDRCVRRRRSVDRELADDRHRYRRAGA